jgi:hypothetical protein
MEAGYLRRTTPDGIQQATPLLLKLTVVERVQLQLGTNGAILSQQYANSRYVDDAVFLGKWVAVEQTPRAPAVAISGAVSAPVWAHADGFQRTWDAFFTLYVTKDIGWLHADFNAGVNLWRVDDPLPQGFATLAVSRDLPWHFGVMAECYGFSDALPISPPDAGFLAALSFTPVPFLVIDAGADVGFIRSTRSYNVFAGMTIALPRLWGPKAQTNTSPPAHSATAITPNFASRISREQ